MPQKSGDILPDRMNTKTAAVVTMINQRKSLVPFRLRLVSRGWIRHRVSTFAVIGTIVYCSALFGCTSSTARQLVPCEPGTLTKVLERRATNGLGAGDTETVAQALTAAADSLARRDLSTKLKLGPYEITRGELVQTNRILAEQMRRWGGGPGLGAYIETQFVTACSDEPGSGLVTGYYEPVFKGSLKPNSVYRYPIYNVPSDLIRVNDDPQFPLGRARRLVDGTTFAHFTRHQIDYQGALVGRGLEIAWLASAIDRAFLHIQGSGRISLTDGRTLRVGFAEKNGHPYRPIGRSLIEREKLSRSEVSMQAIRAYLEAHPEDQPTTLAYDPSYVFFREMGIAAAGDPEATGYSGPIGSLGTALTPLATGAVDPKIYPLGTPLLLDTMVTEFRDNSSQPNGGQQRPFIQFISAQDTGGAITGVERVDLFIGTGDQAGASAGVQKAPGRIIAVVKQR